MEDDASGRGGASGGGCGLSEAAGAVPGVVDQRRVKHTREEDATGAVVWDDSVVLLRWLERQGYAPTRGRTVVELGAGCGLVAAALARAGAARAIVATESRMCGALPLLRANVAQASPLMLFSPIEARASNHSSLSAQ